MAAVIQVKRGSASSWTSANTVLAAGEIGFETDTKKMKVGDGSTAWTSLAYTATDGDISGVTAGTGLSGGGTSGAVTVSLDTSSQYVVPSQSTHSGKYLTTDGTTSSWGTVDLSGKTDKNTLTTTGDIYYASAANTPARLGIGSTDQVLKVSGGLPVWGTASGGAIKQIVYAATSSNTSASGAGTGNLQDVAGLTATITPSSSSSKIWVSMWMNVNHNRTSSDRAQASWRLIRGSTEISNSTHRPGHMVIIGPEGEMYTTFDAQIDHVDSPNTTSPTTYKIAYVGTASGDESWTVYSGAHIFLMEI